MKTFSDTSPEAERVMVGAYRAMSPARKWTLLGDLYRTGRSLHAAGVRLRSPGATAVEIESDWASAHVGSIGEYAQRGAGSMNPPLENLQVVREVIDAFDTLGIVYALGGSLASSIHGIGRLTTDADMAVEPFEGLEDSLVAMFGSDYYVSATAVKQAVMDRSTFNIINTSLGFKVDVFVRKDRPFDQSLINRRIFALIDASTAGPIAVVSPEDMILLKLEWYRLTGGSSIASGLTCRACFVSRPGGLTRRISTAGRPTWTWLTCSKKPDVMP